jgi:hypothetical protein
MRRLKQLGIAAVVSVLGLIVATACGGGGAGVSAPSPGPVAYAGTYVGEYTRSPTTGSIVLAVTSDGALEVTVTDFQLGVFDGRGRVAGDGSFSVNAAGAGSASILLSGRFRVSPDGSAAASGSITGAFVVNSWTAARIGGADSNPLAGDWSGTYSGGEAGTWVATIRPDGTVSARADSPSCGAVTLTGRVTQTGKATFEGAGSGLCSQYRITWTGSFYTRGGQWVGSGTWSSTSGLSGVWSGAKGATEDVFRLVVFPLPNRTHYTARINAVFDHSMSSPYCPDDRVVAYTGEEGLKIYGADLIGNVTGCGNLYGFKNAGGTAFSIGGQYDGGGNAYYLYYDGHPGYDYRTTDQCPGGVVTPDCPTGVRGQIRVRAAATGRVKNINITYGRVEIDHGNGYETWYMHLSRIDVTLGMQVMAGQYIGISGDTGSPGAPHLHFEVRLNGVPVDPYGWRGFGPDPYTRAPNRFLWAVTSSGGSRLLGPRKALAAVPIICPWSGNPVYVAGAFGTYPALVDRVTLTDSGFADHLLSNFWLCRDFTTTASGQGQEGTLSRSTGIGGFLSIAFGLVGFSLLWRVRHRIVRS